MYARVATFNMGEGVDEAIQQVRSDVEKDNRPPGLEGREGDDDAHRPQQRESDGNHPVRQ
jgi:hypothetical protein